MNIHQNNTFASSSSSSYDGSDHNSLLFMNVKKIRASICLRAANNKEKSLKQKMMDGIAKAIIANDGVSITTKEHNSVVSKIKKKARQKMSHEAYRHKA
ncbi:hypothetical protein Tco_0267079 [Tanacetum coccineum]